MKKLVLLLMVVALASCESTRITSMRDPASRNMHFHKLFVKADYSDFDMTRKVEGGLVRSLWFYGVPCTAANVVLPPLREYTADEVRAAVTQEGADGLLLVTPNGSSSLTVTQAYASRYSASATSYESLSEVNTDIQLYDIASGKLVWRGQAKSSIPHDGYGNAWGSLSGAIKSLAEEATDRLVRYEQLVVPAPQHFVDSVNDALSRQ